MAPSAKNSLLPDLHKFSLLKIKTMLFDAMVQTEGFYQDKLTWRGNKNILKRAHFLKSRTKLQFPNDVLRALHFIIFIWKECTRSQLFQYVEKLLLWYCQCPSVSENIVLLYTYGRILCIIFTEAWFFIAPFIFIYLQKILESPCLRFWCFQEK